MKWISAWEKTSDIHRIPSLHPFGTAKDFVEELTQFVSRTLIVYIICRPGHCEENGRMVCADASKVSSRAKQRGFPQLGTLGAGNHYAEIKVVDEIFDKAAASAMGIEETGQVCVMIHSGSRCFGHQVATDALAQMEKAMKRDKIVTNDRQLACVRISSKEGENY